MPRRSVLAASFVLFALLPGALGAQAGGQPGGAALNASMPAAVLGTTFTYQGQLQRSGALISGNCDMAFRLYDDALAGALVGSAITTTVAVAGGLFTVPLDFGVGVFDGSARWLAIQVKCGADVGFTALVQRQALTAAPYALALPGLYTEPNVSSPNVIGGYSGNVIPTFVRGGVIAGGGQAFFLNTVSANFGAIGGGERNTVIGGGGSYVGGGTGNTAGGGLTVVSGGEGNQAIDSFDSTIAGGAHNIVTGNGASIGGGGLHSFGYGGNLASGSASTIAGGKSNVITATLGAVGGGLTNTVTGKYGVIGGGQANLASGSGSTIAGGAYNLATGEGASIGGGGWDGHSYGGNQASGDASTIAGGQGNVITATYGAIGGGQINTVTGQYGTIGGGRDNIASGAGASIGGGGFSGFAFGGNLAAGGASAIGGGIGNTVTGILGFIGGGTSNSASGFASAIPGGIQNQAAGYHSFAAGTNASAPFDGDFVWSDGATIFGSYFIATGSNQFLVHAAGGVGVNTTTPGATLDVSGTVRVGSNGSVGSVFSVIQSGVITAGTSSSASLVYTMTFPSAFSAMPKVIVTASNDPSFGGGDLGDTFVVSVRRVSTTNAVFNILRVDAAVGWSQSLELNWMAWQ